MPRIARVFEKVLQNPEKVFLLKNEPLPKDHKEFLYADLFGDWWRRFRIGENSIVKFLSSEKNLTEFINSLVVSDFSRSEECLKQCHGAALSCLVLTNDEIKPILIQNQNHLHHLISLVNENKGREHTLRFFRDTVEAIIESHSEEITNYFENNKKIFEILFSNINYGNVFAIFFSIVNKSVRYQYIKHHHLLYLFCLHLFDKFYCFSNEYLDLYENLNIFFEILCTDDAFLNSSYSNQLVQFMIKENSNFFQKIFQFIIKNNEISIQFIQFLKTLLIKNSRKISSDDDDDDDENDENDDTNSDSSENSSSSSKNSEDSESSDKNLFSSSSESSQNVYFPFPDVIPSLLHEFLSVKDQMLSILFEPIHDSSISYFGIFRSKFLEFIMICLYEIKDIKVFTNDQLISLWKLFYKFPFNNILQNYIVNIFSFLSSLSGGISLLLKSNVIQEIGNLIISSDGNSCFYGHLASMCSSFMNFDDSNSIKNSFSDWSKVIHIVNDYSTVIKPYEVKRRNRNLVTDRYEDRI